MAVVSQWNAARFQRIRDELSACVSKVERCPIASTKDPNPYAKIGEVIYRAAFEQFKPDEIPSPLRACPWVYVIGEITKHFPQESWNEKSLLRTVEFYRSRIEREPAREEGLSLLGWGMTSCEKRPL